MSICCCKIDTICFLFTSKLSNKCNKQEAGNIMHGNQPKCLHVSFINFYFIF